MIEKKKQGEHTTITTPPGFSIRSCILRTIFRTDATLSHFTSSLSHKSEIVSCDAGSACLSDMFS